MTLNEQKIQAKQLYIERKTDYLNNPTPDNFKKFCDAKRYCMLLGVRI